MEDKKILVTGGAGFIGSHLVNTIKNDNEVLVIDNLTEGDRDNIGEKVNFQKLDIRNKSDLDEAVKAFNPDIVFHLAAQNNAMGSIENPSKTIDINVKGTVNLLEACRKHDVQKIVYASSGGLSYGEAEDVPTTETENLEPVYPYGVSKASGSLFVKDYGRRYDLDFAIMRLGSVYGPRANGGVIKNFFQKIAEDEKPVIYGDGLQSRDFIYVSDVVNGLVAGAEKGYGIYNLSTGTQISIKHLLEKIGEITDLGLKADYEDRWQGDIDRCELSIKKAEQDLDWRPEIDLYEGLIKCRDHYLEE